MKVPSETALRRRVALWQRRLAPLGISHWEISSLTILPSDEMPHGPSVASVYLPNHYDRMALWFSIEEIEDMDSADDLDLTIVHELVHVAMRDIDLAINSAEQGLSPAAADAWQSRMHHERERLVDRMARALVHAYRA